MQNYESSHEVFPPGVVNDTGPVLDQPKGYHFGWLVRILPYCEMRNTYNHFNLAVSVYDEPEPDDPDDAGAQLPLPVRHGPNRTRTGSS